MGEEKTAREAKKNLKKKLKKRENKGENILDRLNKGSIKNTA